MIFLVSGNKLKELPVSICDLPSLRTLDISHNQIKSLPKGMWHVRTLENLIIDAEEMIYPPAGELACVYILPLCITKLPVIR